eukprot:6381647-Lingulodinium_polyedra.AAC.1
MSFTPPRQEQPVLPPRWWPDPAVAAPHLAQRPPDVARDFAAPSFLAVRKVRAVGGGNSIPWD